MVDTGSQVTVIDPSLAAELDLKPQGRVGLVSVASFAQASVTLLDTLEADSKVVEKSPAIVQDLRQIQAADPRIRGVLGESFPRSLRPADRLWAQIALSRRDKRDAG